MTAHAPARSYVVAARVFSVALGALAVSWGALVFPGFWAQAAVHRIADRVVAGDPFKLENLIGQASSLSTVEQAWPCSAAARRSAAVVRTRMAEDALAEGRRDLIDSSLDSARESIRGALACSPANPFLWLALLWVENTRDGFNPGRLGYLRLSYLLGPNEGWIAVKRNHVALALFEQLPPAVADMALDEFTRLVASGLHEQAVALLTGPGWRIRDVLLARLQAVPEQHRRALAQILYDRGYDVQVPGVAVSEKLPGR